MFFVVDLIRAAEKGCHSRTHRLKEEGKKL